MEIAVHAAKAARNVPAAIAATGIRDRGQTLRASPITTAHHIPTVEPAINSWE